MGPQSPVTRSRMLVIASATVAGWFKMISPVSVAPEARCIRLSAKAKLTVGFSSSSVAASDEDLAVAMGCIPNTYCVLPPSRIRRSTVNDAPVGVSLFNWPTLIVKFPCTAGDKGCQESPDFSSTSNGIVSCVAAALSRRINKSFDVGMCRFAVSSVGRIR